MNNIIEPCAVERVKVSAHTINHVAWRKVLLSIDRELKELHPSFSACGPFGFELGWVAANAPQHIRKFYIYTNNPTTEKTSVVASTVQKIAFRNIKKLYPEIADDFVALIRNQDVELLQGENYQCKLSDKLLDIQVRNVSTDILLDYANYVILAYQSILQKTGEAKNYEESALCRSRMFQLFIMIKKLYERFVSNTNLVDFEQATKMVSPFINNNVQIFFTKAWDLCVPVTKEEMIIINKQVLSLCELVDEVLLKSTESNATVKINIQPYHVKAEKNLQVILSKKLHLLLTEHIITSYKNFVDLRK